MLTEDERAQLRLITSDLGPLTYRERQLKAIIDRLTTPRAVLDEAERLLRERKVWTVGLEATEEAGLVYGDDKELRAPSLADAYEALADGEVG